MIKLRTTILYSLLPSVLLLSSCSSSPPKPQLPGWPDNVFGENMQTGKDMIDQHHPILARASYEDSIEQAKLAGDPNAIGQAYYNLGISDLLANDLIQFDKDIAEADETLAKFNINNDYRLNLLKSAAATKKGNSEVGITLASQVLDTPDIPNSFKAQANFLKGVDAAALENSELAHQSLTNLTRLVKTPYEKNNLLELIVRVELLDGKNEKALKDSKDLVYQRQQEQNYTSMQEALVLEMKALRATGGTDQEVFQLERQMNQSKAAQEKILASEG